MKNISPVVLKVALVEEVLRARIVSFLAIWTAPSTVLKIAKGALALLDVQYLVFYEDLTAQDLHLGIPFLRHLGVDTKTLLEEGRDTFDGSD